MCTERVLCQSIELEYILFSRGSLNSLHLGIAVGIQKESSKTPDNRLSSIYANHPSPFYDISNPNGDVLTRSDYGTGDNGAIQTIESTDEGLANNARYATSANTTHETYESS